MKTLLFCIGTLSACLTTQAGAQLSSPLGSSAPVQAGNGVAGTQAGRSGFQGQGAGVHSPLSPFAPLKPRADVVPWSVLTDVKTQLQNRRIVPVYPMAVMALNHRTQRIQGFMLPLDSGEQQRHFLLASVPPTCAFCTPGGPESMVEVRTREPVKYGLGAVVVEGQFRVLIDDPSGLYYRMTEAAGVK